LTGVKRYRGPSGSRLGFFRGRLAIEPPCLRNQVERTRALLAGAGSPRPPLNGRRRRLNMTAA
jgi:hypothetical protein